MNIKKIIRQLSLYSIVGTTATILNIFLIWLLIDHLHLHPGLGTGIVVIIIFTYKYLMFIKINLLHKNLLKFLMINGASALLNWSLTWLLITLLPYPAALISTAVIILLFGLRFFMYRWFKLMK